MRIIARKTLTGFVESLRGSKESESGQIGTGFLVPMKSKVRIGVDLLTLRGTT